MYQLYYSAGSCALAIHALLAELGVSYELVDASISEGKNRTPEFLKLNPRGSVPVLVDDGFVIREGGAQMVYLCDKHQSPLLPESGRERAVALEWLMFANASMHPLYGRLFWLNKIDLAEDAKKAVRAKTCEAINKLWAELDGILAKSRYSSGDELRAGDILLAVIANWSKGFSEITLGENVKRMLKEVSARPAFQKAMAEEKVEYKVAA